MSPRTTVSSPAASAGERGQPDDEISLYDLWQMLRDGWRWPAVGGLVGLVAAAVYLAVTPPQYEATLLIKIGQAGPTPVESTAQAIDRLKLASFQGQVLKSLNWSADARAALYRSSLKGTPRNDLIDLRVRGVSAEDARRSAEVTLEELGKSHGDLAKAVDRSVAAKAEAELANLAAEVVEAEALLARLDRLGKEIPSSAHREILTWLQMVDKQKSLLRNLRRQEAVTRQELTPAPLMATAAVEVAVSDSPVYPKVRRVWAVGVFGGLFLGVIAIILRRGWQAGRAGGARP